MINSFTFALTKIRKRPSILVPGILIGIVNYVLILLMFFLVQDFIFSILFEESLPLTDIFSGLHFFVFNNWLPLAIIFIFSLIMGTLNLSIALFYSKLAMKTEKFEATFNSSLRRWKELVWAIIFLYIISFLLGVILYLIFNLFSFNFLALFIALLASFIALLFIAMKFIFSFSIMALNNESFQNSLKSSWNFTQGKIGSILMIFLTLIIVLGFLEGAALILNLLIESIFDFLAGSLAIMAGENETLFNTLFFFVDADIWGNLAFIFIGTIGIAFAYLYLGRFYLSNK
ncbi:MAG TPA: hypothetical protein VJK05_03615 [archaeon]|nr:hypothetical protein [archaeon]